MVVNNAGVTEDGLIMRMNYEQWSKVIQTNLSSNYQIIKTLLPNLLSNRYGKIIGISSIVGTTEIQAKLIMWHQNPVSVVFINQLL